MRVVVRHARSPLVPRVLAGAQVGLLASLLVALAYTGGLFLQAHAPAVVWPVGALAALVSAGAVGLASGQVRRR